MSSIHSSSSSSSPPLDSSTAPSSSSTASFSASSSSAPSSSSLGASSSSSSSSSPPPCLILFVCGDQSGVGKSSLCLSLLHLLSHSLPSLFPPSSLSYIKPATQCEDVQLVSKFCSQRGISHVPLGPVIFSPGYTQQDIDQYIERKREGGRAFADQMYEERLERVARAVEAAAKGKAFCLVDGVGYPSVGSVCGVSNAAVARKLRAPVLAVGRGGIGNAIDAMNNIISFFSAHGVRVIGGVFNKIPFLPHRLNNYHSYERCEEYVRKYFTHCRNSEGEGEFHCYGFIPLIEKEAKEKEGAAAELSSPPPVEEVTCMLRPAKKDLEMSEEEKVYVEKMLQVVEKHLDLKLLIDDIKAYYKSQT